MATQAERSQVTRSRILASALRLCVARGWAATSIDDVARAAGLTKGALYHHFADKTALLRALYELQEEGLVDRLVAVAGVTSDPLAALRAGCREFLRSCREPAFRQLVLVDAPAVLGWAEWRALDARYGLGLLRTAVEAAVDAGQLRPLPIDHVTRLLLAALMEAALLSTQSNGDADQAQAVGAFDAVVDGLCR